MPVAGDRNKKGQFRKGNSAGRGRQMGSRNRLTAEMEKLAETNGAGVFQTMIAAAMQGDVAAAQLVLRPYLARVGKAKPVRLPKIKTAKDVVAAMAEITAAVGRGDLTVSEGRELAALVDLNRQAIATHDHEDRIAALETKERPDDEP